MLFWKKSLPGSLYCQTRLQQLPTIPVDSSSYNILETPTRCFSRVLELIASAKERIMITALYLQDDEVGRKVLNALYEAKAKNPKLYVRVYVDFHRAQRGLIGKGPSLGNSELYYSLAKDCETPPAVYGVPVKRREIFGVMHLKGFVFDDTVLYTGASINNVYMDFDGKYRLDRYHEIHSKDLANVMCAYATNAFHPNYAVQDFSQEKVKPAKEMRDEIKELRRHLTNVQYTFKNEKIHDYQIGLTPLAGLGKKANQLNRAVMWLLGAAREKLFICTPYFNPPKIVSQAIENALARDVTVTLVVGAKRANDFFIREGENFSPIGAIPYIYEQNLKDFVEKNQEYINQGLLKIMLWEDGNNTYHVKGMYIDNNMALITGNNLNPRAWSLDLENGIVISDPYHQLNEKFSHEQQYLLKHTKQIKTPADLESFENYPEEVQKILKKVKRLRASIFIKQLL
ncbi:MAG: CDP-diacylglycerol--serine O-phosphatidyltransferase [Aeromonadales bacterium]|nr:CDP-diacylglycerol--serine O-phosphatidyltransferase [Aeromonadales bacterium]